MAGWTSTISTGCSSTSSSPSAPRLSRELRKAGERDAAAEVAALKKPSVAAWAVNQLVRTQRKGGGGAARGRGRAARGAGRRARGPRRRALAPCGGRRASGRRCRSSPTPRGDCSSSEGEELSDDDASSASPTRCTPPRSTTRRASRSARGGSSASCATSGSACRHPVARRAPAPARPGGEQDRVPPSARRPRSRPARPRTEQAAEQERALREQAKAREEARREARATEREARRHAERAERGAEVALERRDRAAVALTRGRGRSSRRRRTRWPRRGAAAGRRGGGPRGEPVAQRSSAITITHDHEQSPERRAAESPPAAGATRTRGRRGRGCSGPRAGCRPSHRRRRRDSQPQVRVQAMDYRTLGRTGVKVSPLCLGAMMFGAWGNTDHDECIRIIHRALDAGINFIDTADVYSRGESEEIVGKALAGGGATTWCSPPRCTGRWATTRTSSATPAAGSSREVENSLRRLGTDWIDLYQIHRPESDTDIDETLGALTDLVRAGKVRYIGSSTFPPSQIVEAQWVAERRGRERFVCEQPPYSILVRGVENDVLPDLPAARDGRDPVEPACRRVAERPVPQGRRACPSRTARNGSRLATTCRCRGTSASSRPPTALAKLAEEAGMTLIEMALAFVLTPSGGDRADHRAAHDGAARVAAARRRGDAQRRACSTGSTSSCRPAST